MTFEQFSVDRGVLIYRERLSPWLRIFVAAFALCMLMLPAIAARILSETEDPGIAEWAFVVFAFVFTGFFVAVLFRAALAELKHMRFDSAAREIHLSAEGPFWRHEKRIPYQDVESLGVLKRDGLDDPPHYVILLEIKTDSRVIEMGPLATEADAEIWKQRMQELGLPGTDAP